MNRQEFESNWKSHKANILGKWPKITDEDLTRIDGKYDAFLMQVQKKYGYPRDKAEMEIKSFSCGAPAGGKVESIGSCDAKCNERKGKDERHEKKRKAG